MAYNRINLLSRIVEIQDITLEHTRKGVTQQWVYENLIYPTYKISRRTYYSYLTQWAKAELKRLEEKKQAANKVKQLELF